MAKNVKGNKGKKGISVDLTGVETGMKAIPEGTYSVKITEAELSKSQSGNPMVKVVFEVTEGKNKGAKLFENVSLQPQALFKLKSILLAVGYDIPDGAFDLDVNDLLDLECQVEVAHEKYEGKNKARIVEFIGEDEGDDSDDEDDDDDDEDEDDDSDDEEDDEDEGEEDYESMSLKDLKALAKEKGIKVTKGMGKDEIIEALEEAEDDDEEDDEDEEDEVDYSSMSLKDLKALAREKGIKVKKGMGKDEIIEALEDDEE
jgi:hypothetical protein